MYNRYYELKNLYKDYLIIIKNKNKYKLYDKDREIYTFLNVKNHKYLKKYKINFIFLDNLDIIELHKYEDNKYLEYYAKCSLINTFKDIKKGFAYE